ncbi:hypothetical protein [Nakamurella sp.]|uniref:hypothetical protein n=1 Tax=Nakamurella sp. TaxID=1869182 RepID=UPI003B3B0842
MSSPTVPTTPTTPAVPTRPTAPASPTVPTGPAGSSGLRRVAPDPAPAGTPAPSRRRTGWFIAGIALLVISALQLIRLPEWLTYDEHGLVGHLTSLVTTVAIGSALILTARARRA